MKSNVKGQNWKTKSSTKDIKSKTNSNKKTRVKIDTNTIDMTLLNF
jgi:hypothetical protein